MELVPMKVKIGLRPNGEADHPDWTKLKIVQDSGLGDKYKQDPTGGWKYDKTSGHAVKSVGSAIGSQLGMLLVEEEFYNQAKAEFGTIITRMTEAQAKDFYDNKVKAHLPENKYNETVLNGLDVELRLRDSLGEDTTELKAKIAKALNPKDKEPGISVNTNKTWEGFKAQCGFTIKEAS